MSQFLHAEFYVRRLYRNTGCSRKRLGTKPIRFEALPRVVSYFPVAAMLRNCQKIDKKTEFT